MPDGPLTSLERRVLGDLRALLRERAERQAAIESEAEAGTAGAEAQLRRELEQADEEASQVRLAAGDEASRRADEVQRRAAAALAANDRSRDAAVADITERADHERSRAEKRLQESTWMAETLYEPHAHKPREKFEQSRKVIDQAVADALVVERSAAESLARLGRRPDRLLVAPTGELDQAGDAVDAIQREVEAAQYGFRRLDSLVLARMTITPLLVVYVLGAAAGGAALTWVYLKGATPAVIGAAGSGATLLIAGLLVLLSRVASRQVARAAGRIAGSVARIRRLAPIAVEQAMRARQQEEAALREPRDREIRSAREKHELAAVEVRRVSAERIAEIRARHLAAEEAITAERDAEVAAAQEKGELAIRLAEQTHAEVTARVRATAGARREQARAAEVEGWAALEADWRTRIASIRADLEKVGRAERRSAPAWSEVLSDDYSTTEVGERLARIGSVQIDLTAMPGGVPGDLRLDLAGPANFALPVLLELPERGSLLIRTGGEGRAEAIGTLQATMLRLLATFPPGKVRFTIIDPVGLGESFAGFMHLADFEPLLVSDRIWTEPRHIEARLADLTEHMETVIQKYLRNEFASIDEYNRHAGEVAEPFRFLVIADYPVSFDEAAAKRLASIITSGPRCGVHALIAMDTRRPAPPGLPIADLERACVRVVWKRGTMVLEDPDFADLPLALDAPAATNEFTRVVHAVGSRSKDAGRVQVPFKHVAPPEQLWPLSTADEVRIPLGRAGATKLQYITLGRGTAQHALIAGRTGSGKSTLLHVLITNLALWYSPDEVELYLVDFKKGVEFKTYARLELPHARVVAIESEREFGISVLRRLDAEMKRRGEMFRELIVQDVAGYREVSGRKLARILLIVDEFQEMFVEDDKLGQEAALLLDRLVRQGRAFGMHVVLGSQTLGGAFSLARSTMGQMAVRIALQCSEADSYLILSDDNSAARLLTRPGEAIYNDASGAVQGNSPFQISWLEDQEREIRLEAVRRRWENQGHRPGSMIVFEGHAPADISRNRALDAALAAKGSAAASGAVAWLGEPIAIKDPTGPVLRRQEGGNVLIVGQRDEAAVAMLASAMVGLAAQHGLGVVDGTGAAARFVVFDGSTPDSASAGLIAGVAQRLGIRSDVVEYKDTPGAVLSLAAELARRQDEDRLGYPPVYLLVLGLQRYRALRRPENEFDFSSDSSGEATADKHFAAILREGPSVGIHAIVWCDTVATLNRTLDRQAIRGFDHRVAFQMSASDSSSLIDSPAASVLGQHRALYFNEEQGLTEKFRPYAMPSDGFIAEVARRLAEGAAGGAGAAAPR
ncbi:MAG: AAA family ATPase [Phycisphaeraceae bacterium]|nr:AAA family ATPase [Phycisphaeraceae bacterium]